MPKLLGLSLLLLCFALPASADSFNANFTCVGPCPMSLPTSPVWVLGPGSISTMEFSFDNFAPNFLGFPQDWKPSDSYIWSMSQFSVIPEGSCCQDDFRILGIFNQNTLSSASGMFLIGSGFDLPPLSEEGNLAFPEPSTMLLLGLGMLALTFTRRRI